MRTIPTLVAGIALTIAMSGCSRQPTGVAAAAEAMGATGVNSIQYSGTGSNFAFGQAFSPGERWPRFEVKTSRWRSTIRRRRAAGELRARATPPRGRRRPALRAGPADDQVVSGTHAWTEAGPAANPGAGH
jgi:hypothetical protein